MQDLITIQYYTNNPKTIKKSQLIAIEQAK